MFHNHDVLEHPDLRKARLELFALLDTFPASADDLYSAVVGKAVHGKYMEAGRTLGSFALGCNCAIGTVAESAHVTWNKAYARVVAKIGEGEVWPLKALPNLESYLYDVGPDGGGRKLPMLAQWIEEWMQEQDSKARSGE